ncbi:MAG TPA: hypothetical protein VGK27_08990 [Candidatus Deferrimicrobiaceae bacterium]|jgi:hypothetical protein
MSKAIFAMAFSVITLFASVLVRAESWVEFSGVQATNEKTGEILFVTESYYDKDSIRLVGDNTYKFWTKAVRTITGSPNNDIYEKMKDETTKDLVAINCSDKTFEVLTKTEKQLIEDWMPEDLKNRVRKTIKGNVFDLDYYAKLWIAVCK